MATQLPKLILASRSPRRRELLAAAGYPFEVHPPAETAECGVCSGETAAELVARLAYQKAADVARRIREGLVLGCDTVAECRGQILGKPLDQAHARAMLTTLSGREHHVLSGLCLWPVPDGRPAVRVAVTTLRMDPPYATTTGRVSGQRPMGGQGGCVRLSGRARLGPRCRRQRVERGRTAHGTVGRNGPSLLPIKLPLAFRQKRAARRSSSHGACWRQSTASLGNRRRAARGFPEATSRGLDYFRTISLRLRRARSLTLL